MSFIAPAAQNCFFPEPGHGATRYLNDSILDFFLFQSIAELLLASVAEPGLKTEPRARLQSSVI